MAPCFGGNFIAGALWSLFWRFHIFTFSCCIPFGFIISTPSIPIVLVVLFSFLLLFLWLSVWGHRKIVNNFKCSVWNCNAQTHKPSFSLFSLVHLHLSICFSSFDMCELLFGFYFPIWQSLSYTKHWVHTGSSAWDSF